MSDATHEPQQPQKRPVRGGNLYADTDRIKHFRMSKRDAACYGLVREQRIVEVRYDHEQAEADPARWTVDEICAAGLHLEGMDIDAVWMDVCGVHVWFHAERVKGSRKLRLVVTCFPNTAKPYVLTPEDAVLERHVAQQVLTEPGP